MHNHYILVDILVAQELIHKGKEHIARGEQLLRFVSKNLDKGGTSIACFKDFEIIDFEKGIPSFKTHSPN